MEPETNSLLLNPFPRDRDGVPAPPTASELSLHPGILVEAEEIFAAFGEPPISSSVLELLVRAIVWADRVQTLRSRDLSCQDAERPSQS